MPSSSTACETTRHVACAQVPANLLLRRPLQQPHPRCNHMLLQELLLSYNIGIPVEQREQDMNKRAANMVGLQMPKVLE